MEEKQKHGEGVLAVRVHPGKRREPPRDWDIVFYDDDRTSAGFVVFLLMHVFGRTREESAQLTRAIELEGRKAVASYPHAVAEMKRERCVSEARQLGYPLRVELERPEEDGE